MKALAEITGKYIGRPFSEIGCIDLMHAIYTDMGFDAPDSFGSLTLENYREAFRENSKLTQARMLQLLKSLGRPVDIISVKIYDLVVIMQKGNIIYPGMYIGRGMFITSTVKEGVMVAHIGKMNRLIMARRLI